MIVYDGLNNLTWFMGIVEDNNDLLKAGRVKIRAFGFHPTIEEDTVDSADLPWAPVLSSGIHMHVPIDIGELVFGAFLDGRDAQQPLVFGVIPTAKFSIPVTSQGTGGGAGQSGQVGSSGVSSVFMTGETADILQTIRTKESGGDYTAENGGTRYAEKNAAGEFIGSTASGAYQYIDSTWQAQAAAAGIGTEYTHAADAPPEVQDAVAAYNVNTILAQNNNNVAVVPNVWYTGNPQGTLSGSAAAVNNGLASSTYQSDWLKIFSSISGTNAGSTAPTGPAGAPIPPTNPMVKNSPDVIDNFGNLAIPPQATGEGQHNTAYGAALTAISSSHPGIAFGGSYKTSVWNARYNGSYIEVHPGSNPHEEHINLVTSAGSSITMDSQGNISIKSTGRVYIESDNNVDTKAEGYTTNISKGGHEILVEGGDLTLRTSGDLRLNSGSNIYLGAGKDIFMTSGGSIGLLSPTLGITTYGGPINIRSGQTITIQSDSEIMAKAVNMSMNISGILGIESIGDMIIKGQNISIGASGKLNQKGAGGAVLEGSTLGLKSGGYATLQAGGFANIVGAQVHLNDGGSVDSIEMPSVTQIGDISGAAITPKDADGKETSDATPPTLGTNAKAKPKNPTPGTISSNNTDDVGPQ